MTDLSTLSAAWLIAKQQETDATARRRDIEDHMAKLAAVPADLDGTAGLEAGQYALKITGRIDRKVDADKLQAIAIEHGLTDHLGHLFRWKPELNLPAWRAADPAIVRPLANAITAKPGRPSFKVTIKE